MSSGSSSRVATEGTPTRTAKTNSGAAMSALSRAWPVQVTAAPGNGEGSTGAGTAVGRWRVTSKPLSSPSVKHDRPISGVDQVRSLDTTGRASSTSPAHAKAWA